MPLNRQSAFSWPSVTTARLFSLGLPHAGDPNFHFSFSVWFLRHLCCLIQVDNAAPTLASVATCTVENGAVLEKPQGCGAGAQCCIASTNHFQPCVWGDRLGLLQLECSSWSWHKAEQCGWAHLATPSCDSSPLLCLVLGLSLVLCSLCHTLLLIQSSFCQICSCRGRREGGGFGWQSTGRQR